MLSGDKILNVLMDNLSVEELEELLVRKKSKKAGGPPQMSERRKWINHYKKEIIRLGILHPPKK